MKEYISRKEFKGKDMLGRDITIPAYSNFDLRNQYLRYNNIPICAEYSQVAKDYLVYNGDGQGTKRLGYMNMLLDRNVKWKDGVDVYDDLGNVTKTESTITSGMYSPLEVNYLKERYSKYLKSYSPLLFSNEFYKAPIKDLETIARYMNRKK